MFQRFAAASSIAGIVIAAGALLSFALPIEASRVLTLAWCFVPAVWGVWAMLVPANWVPARLPVWGAILGTMAGVMAGPVLNIPARVGAPTALRWLALVVGPVFYYLLWLLVAMAYRTLQEQTRTDAANSRTLTP